MPRQSRIDTSGALHHVICRGIDRQKIFTDQDDYLLFLKRLADLLIETKTSCFAWTLIPNHFHLLLQTGNIPMIIHYAAHLKPWLYYGLIFDAAWYKYFSISVFKSQKIKRRNGKFKIFCDKILCKMDNAIMLIKIFLRYWKTHGLLFTLRKLKND